MIKTLLLSCSIAAAMAITPALAQSGPPDDPATASAKNTPQKHRAPHRSHARRHRSARVRTVAAKPAGADNDPNGAFMRALGDMFGAIARGPGKAGGTAAAGE